jgi:hypothetical protein
MTTAAVCEHACSIYGVYLKFVTTSGAIAAPVANVLRSFPRECGDGSGVLTIQLDAVRCREEIPVRLSGTAYELSFTPGSDADESHSRPAWPHRVMRDGARLIADFFDEGLLVIDPSREIVEGYLIDPDTMSPEAVEWLFHTALVQLLKHRGLFTVHATALELGGLGVLIPGHSGRGKTTAFVSLLRAGYRYLSDDHPLLSDNAGHLEVLSFPLRVDVTDPTVSFFPELRDASASVLRQGLNKRYFFPEDIYEAAVIGTRCRPAVMLFPHVSDLLHSCLEPLRKCEALEAILPHALMVYDHDIARKEFHLLSKLVQETDCYRLHFGRDVLDLPRLITPLLQGRR